MFCNSCRVPLSSIELGAERIGYLAAEMLDKLIRGEEVETQILVPPIGVVERRSSDFTAVDDEEMAKVLRHVRNNLEADLGLDALAEVAHVSRRSFEDKFKALIGRSPAAEVRRIRIEHARQLLVATELSLDEIATQCGFRRRERLHEAFKKITNCSPIAYRNNFGS